MRLILLFTLLMSLVGRAQENISLIAPYDSDTIETKNPLLTWAYLNGIQQNGREYYRIIVVELKDNQSAEAAIIVNQPLLKMDRVPGTQLFYPYDAPELEEGIWYGWQVQKIVNNTIVDKSEAWKFIIPVPKESKPQYYKMKVKNDGANYTAVEGKLYFEFTQKYNDDDLKFYLYDTKNKLMDVQISIAKGDEKSTNINVVRNGSNYFEIDLGGYVQLGTYRLVVMDAKKQKYELKFDVK